MDQWLTRLSVSVEQRDFDADQESQATGSVTHRNGLLLLPEERLRGLGRRLAQPQEPGDKGHNRSQPQEQRVSYIAASVLGVHTCE